MKHRILSLALAALLALGSAGCSGGGGQKPDTAMGRYVETEISLPAASVMGILGMQARPDGTVDLLCYANRQEAGPLEIVWYQSADGGATWTVKDCLALEEVFSPVDTNAALNTACWDAEGRLYVYYEEYVSNVGGVVRDGIAVVDDSGVTMLDWSMPKTTDGSNVVAIRVADNGDILLGGVLEIRQVDRDTGAVKYSYMSKDRLGSVDGWDVLENTLWFSENDGIRSFDLTTGKEGETLPATASTQEGSNYGTVYRMVSATENGIYYADEHGLFRALPGNSVSEKLLDGNMCSLGLPSVDRISMVALPEGFLVLGYAGSAYHIYSYRYDPETPTFAANELRVWSLADDPLIRQAIGVFQKSHSDVYISYEPAMVEGSAVTRDDALKTLSTELVAGKGPDVLVLDGVPIQSYIDKGVLKDIAGEIKPLMDDGTLLANQAGAYLEESGAMYAVPALFQVPMLQCDAPGVTDLTALADWVEKNQGSFVHPVSGFDAEDLLTFFYPISAPTDEAGLRALLTDLGRVYDVERAKAYDNYQKSDLDFNFTAIFWSAGGTGLNTGNLQKFEYLYPAWQVLQDTGKGTIDTLFGGDGFLPKTVLGVTAQSPQGALGAEFIQTVLSEEVQASKVGAGLAVNAEAFTAGTLEPEDAKQYGDRYSTYGTTLGDAQGADVSIMLTIYYPPEAWREEMAQRMRTLDTPLKVDDTVLQLIIDNTENYFNGKSTLDETMTTLMQKLDLYRSEQGK